MLSLIMILTIQPELAELAQYPHEKVCERNWRMAVKYLEDFDRFRENFGNPWPVQQRIEGVREQLQWQVSFWWACWYVTWPPLTLDQRREWMQRVRELRSMNSAASLPIASRPETCSRSAGLYGRSGFQTTA